MPIQPKLINPCDLQKLSNPSLQITFTTSTNLKEKPRQDSRCSTKQATHRNISCTPNKWWSWDKKMFCCWVRFSLWACISRVMNATFTFSWLWTIWPLYQLSTVSISGKVTRGATNYYICIWHCASFTCTNLDKLTSIKVYWLLFLFLILHWLLVLIMEWLSEYCLPKRDPRQPNATIQQFLVKKALNKYFKSFF